MNSELHIIDRDRTLRQALEQLNGLSGREMTLVVVDSPESMKVCGTLTNGDVRRALLSGLELDDKVERAMHADFRRLQSDAADMVDEMRRMRWDGITIAPVVDGDGRLVDVVDLRQHPTRLPLSAILMAGGKGERLRPLTLDRPKPLLEVDGKAIIDYNVEALARVGIDDITVTARYLAEQIIKHFKQPVGGVQVSCVIENVPLGTIGAASLAPRSGKYAATLVMNSDLLTSVSFEEMYLKHRDSKADITVGVIPYQVSVPYAILGVDGETVTSIEEKPSFSHYANAGIYIFSNEILDTLPSDRPTDAPDLIRKAMAEGYRVTYYVIDGTWIDIGSPTDFRQAGELMRHHTNLSRSEGR